MMEFRLSPTVAWSGESNIKLENKHLPCSFRKLVKYNVYFTHWHKMGETGTVFFCLFVCLLVKSE